MLKDRFLLGILIGIGALVVAALILFFVRQGRSVNVDESTPTGVLQNYLLAIQKQDYERAYQYVAGGPEKMTLEQFRQPFIDYQAGAVNGSSVEIGSSEINDASQTALVQVTILNSAPNLFEPSVRSHDVARLVRQNGAWKVQSMTYPYWPPEPILPAPPKLLPTPTPLPTPTGTTP